MSTQLPYSQLRITAAHAHPDDESSKGAATLAKYKSLGARTAVVTFTGGERGDVLNPALDSPETKKNIAEIRRAEMEKAAKILNIEHTFLGFKDSGLPKNDEPVPSDSFAAVDLSEATAALVSHIRSFKPHVLLTYDDHGGYPHPDHIKTNRATLAAFAAAGDPEQFPEIPGTWQVSKLYYFNAFTIEFFETLSVYAKNNNIEIPSDPDTEQWINSLKKQCPLWPTTTRIRCEEFFVVRREALRAHATQVDPAGPFFYYPLEVEQVAHPFETYHLAISLVDTTVPETDVFAGITSDQPSKKPT